MALVASGSENRPGARLKTPGERDVSYIPPDHGRVRELRGSSHIPNRYRADISCQYPVIRLRLQRHFAVLNREIELRGTSLWISVYLLLSTDALSENRFPGLGSRCDAQ